MEQATCFMDIAANRMGNSGGLFVLPNNFPIRSCHLLLVAPEHREDLRVEDLRGALAFVRAFPDYLVFHNMRGSEASRPEHLHFQALPRDACLPLAVAPRVEVTRFSGARVTRVVDYPAYALAVSGERAPEAALRIAGRLSSTPFNLVLLGGEIVIGPRAREHPSGVGTRFGGLEMAGWTVLVDEEEYRRLTAEAIREAIAECGWSPEVGEVFEKSLPGALANPKRLEAECSAEPPAPLPAAETSVCLAPLSLSKGEGEGARRSLGSRVVELGAKEAMMSGGSDPRRVSLDEELISGTELETTDGMLYRDGQLVQPSGVRRIRDLVEGGVLRLAYVKWWDELDRPLYRLYQNFPHPPKNPAAPDSDWRINVTVLLPGNLGNGRYVLTVGHQNAASQDEIHQVVYGKALFYQQFDEDEGSGSNTPNLVSFHQSISTHGE